MNRKKRNFWLACTRSQDLTLCDFSINFGKRNHVFRETSKFRTLMEHVDDLFTTQLCKTSFFKEVLKRCFMCINNGSGYFDQLL